jgi:hypothetical protein
VATAGLVGEALAVAEPAGGTLAAGVNVVGAGEAPEGVAEPVASRAAAAWI